MFKSRQAICQSCGMPLVKDPKRGGTEADGSRTIEYCSFCYDQGAFTQPDISADEMVVFVHQKLREMRVPGISGAAHDPEYPQAPSLDQRVTRLRLDHLVFAATDLDQGIRAIEQLTGVRPVAGGSHPDWGTRNALLGLGEDCYLEVIGPDLDARGVPSLFGLDRLKSPGVVTWAAGTNDIEEAARRCQSAGIDLGPIASGSRVAADGTRLAWRLSDPFADRMGGVIPFLIDWGSTPHPARNLPSAGTLGALRLGHPHPEAVRRVLDVLGLDYRVDISAAPRLTAAIETGHGTVTID